MIRSKLRFVGGDILKHVKSGMIAHQVNCRGGFGSGIARQIAEMYPDVRQAYINKHNFEGWKLGEVQFVNTRKHTDLWFANMAGQDRFGTDRRHTDYPALETAIRKAAEFSVELNCVLSMPQVGCGLAGGKWSVVKGIIQKILEDIPARIDVFILK